MQFKINPSVFEFFPDYKVGVLVLQGLDQAVNKEEINQLLETAVLAFQSSQRSQENITVWDKAFDKIGLDSREVMPSHKALAERVTKQGKLPSIWPVVDICNVISLKYLLPIGAHRLDTLTDDIEIRPTTASDTFVPMNKDVAEAVEAGILAYTSGSKVLTKNLVWRQGETSKITADTQSVMIPIDTFGNTSEAELLSVMDELGELLTSVVGGSLQTAVLSNTSPAFEWENSSMEVSSSPENTLLSRGVAEVLPSKATLNKLMTERKIRVYLGIDPTGSLLTLGHSVVLRKLQQFADLGHDVILLIGNGTVRIGDPTGRDSTRPVLTDEVIEENFKTWKDQASKILNFDQIRIVRNGDWLDKLTYADMVKLMAQTTVQQLMERDMFQDRLAKGLPVHGHEIMYPLLQGYDSVVMDVDLELGGTDQTFNMMMGRHLQKVYNNHEKWVLTTPIINGTDGRKMSKSYGNFVALTENPTDMYGKLMSIADTMIIEYFTLLTDVESGDIESMTQAMASGENPMTFKKRLAFTITEMYHSTEDANSAQAHFEKTVQQGDIPDDAQEVQLLSAESSLLELLKTCMPEESNSNLRRLAEQSAVELIPSGVKPTDPNQVLDLTQVEVVRIGKRRYFKIVT